MNVQLSWDLFVLVFFIVIVAYSFIIGRNNTLKVILGTYVAALAADSAGNMFGSYFTGSNILGELLKFASLGNEQEAVVMIKVLSFVALVILFAVKGAFSVETSGGRGPIKLLLNGAYAVLSAGLIISVILVFVSGVSFIGGGSQATTGVALWDIYSNSNLVKSIVQNSYLWFSLPAVAFLVHSLRSERD